jgi:hypothetical protein
MIDDNYVVMPVLDVCHDCGNVKLNGNIVRDKDGLPLRNSFGNFFCEHHRDRIIPSRLGRMKFYSVEHKHFPKHYATKLDWDACVIVHSKLCRHYKLPVRLAYNGRRCGVAHAGGLVELGRSGMNVGVLCHEVAHLIAYKRYMSMKHDKKLYRVMSRVMDYALRKNFWSVEIAKRTAPKLVKPLPSIGELRLAKIVKRKESIVRFEKKLRYYTKLYSGKISKARRSIVMLERCSN